MVQTNIPKILYTINWLADSDVFLSITEIWQHLEVTQRPRISMYEYVVGGQYALEVGYLASDSEVGRSIPG